MSPYDSDDLYERLGLSKEANEKEIKRAYRKGARKHHPDVNPGDADAERRFKSISQAYQILSDPKKRELYDRHGMAAFQPGGPAQAEGVNISDFESIFSNLGLDDIMESLFGMGGGRGRTRSEAQRGEDLALRVTISLEDAHTGLEDEKLIETHLPCQHCSASGIKVGTTPRTCARCQGSGQVGIQRGFLVMQSACPQCRGAGREIDPCPQCRGEGRRRGRSRVAFKIPRGIRSGQRVRFTGKGCAGLRGGAKGDLYLHVKVNPHPLFERSGEDLLVQLQLTLTELLLGTKEDLVSLGGEKVTITVPAGSNDGEIIHIRQKGVARRQGGRGDLLVRLKAAQPGRLGRVAKGLLQKLDKILPRPKIRFGK
ncbi:J domain-containing protein [bacterium]|nr:J domain-containing protein [bacterium]